MTKEEVMTELAGYGSESTKRIFLKHGAREPIFGVKVGDLKKIQKKIRKDHELSLALYDTGNGDAMYLAGLIADEAKITKTSLRKWAKKAHWYMISEYTVAWLAADSRYGMELALEWIESNVEHVAAAGWATLSNVVSITPDDALDVRIIEGLMNRVKKELIDAPNRVRYTMNGFVISAGAYIVQLTDPAMEIAKGLGIVAVDMNGTACKVPVADAYLQKIIDKGRVGKKRKMARC